MFKAHRLYNLCKILPQIVLLIIIFNSIWFDNVRAELATKAEMNQVCQNWLTQIVHQNGSWAGLSKPTVSNVEELRTGDTLLATIHHIDPVGFILVPVLKEMVPIKAYSDKYNLDDKQTEGFILLIQELLSNYLNLYIDNYGNLNERQSSDNTIFDPKQKVEWDRLTQPEEKFKTSLLESSDRFLEEAGPLLTSSWHQSYPYNNYCPTGQGGTSYSGCVATAMAQIM